MRRQETDEPEFGRCELVVLPSPDPLFEALQPGGKRSGVGVALECVARNLHKLEGAGEVAEVQADIGAAQREIGFEPGDPMEQWAEPPDVLELARGLRVVTPLLLRQRSCRVGDGALGCLIESRFFDQLFRFDRPSLRVSPIADLCGAAKAI